MASRKRRRAEEAAGPGGAALAPRYQGAAVLDALLARAGSALSAAEVAERFAAAQAGGAERAGVIPTLFPREPRFGSPDEARRLFENLFGLWARVSLGQGEGDEPVAAAGLAAAGDDANEVEAERDPPPPLPERGSVSGRAVGPDVVEAVWQHLADLSPAERRRLRHRFESAQPDLSAWLAAADLPDSGGASALELAFEAWAMLDLAFGERQGTAGWRDLAELLREPPPLEAGQPALAAYVSEQLDNLADEDPAFGPAERAQVERLLAAAAAALDRALDP